jgi:pyruvate dehydrogenase E2 component (dihydrolipoamide acetyltransferase)
MPVETFKLPDVGEGVAEGELVRWLVEEGEEVDEDQPLAEVETDKALVDLPSPFAGTVTERHVEEGEMVPVGTVIVSVDVGGDADENGGAPDAAPTAAAPEGDSRPGGRVFAAPSTRRLARELGVDVDGVDGSGPGGRVTDADVRAAAEGPSQPTPRSVDDSATSAMRGGDEAAVADAGTPRESATPATEAAPAADRERTLAAPATRRLARELGVDLDAVPTDERRDGEAFVTPPMVRAFAERGGEAEPEPAAPTASAADSPPPADDGPRPGDRIPYRGVRRTIGERMEQSKYTAPHVTHTDEVDVTRLVETKAELEPHAEAEGVSLTYLPFVMRAVTRALREFPRVNASLDEDAGEIVCHDEYNLGVATATDAGLMVPVVDGVDGKGLLDLAAETATKVERARDRSIGREEMQGGTFTITNVGVIGGEYATPIVNYPEVAILALGRVAERPRVVDGEVVPRHTLPLSLSVDHRVVDGAVAARFTNRVMALLRSPARLLVD